MEAKHDDAHGVYSIAAAPVYCLGDTSSHDSVVLLGYPRLDDERIRAGAHRIARALT